MRVDDAAGLLRGQVVDVGALMLLRHGGEPRSRRRQPQPEIGSVGSEATVNRVDPSRVQPSRAGLGRDGLGLIEAGPNWDCEGLSRICGRSSQMEQERLTAARRGSAVIE